jgi:hypothetical protein
MPDSGAVSLVERVTLRRVSARSGVASVRLPAVNLHDLAVEQRGDGSLRVTPPKYVGRLGVHRHCFDLQPGAREAVEAAIAGAWAESRWVDHRPRQAVDVVRAGGRHG